eukprot:scaffold638_cov168-Amphora_coffeaeformis.AAC.8
MKAAEEALRQYCDPSLVREYDEMTNKQKTNIREALVTMCRSQVMHHFMQQKQQSTVSTSSSKLANPQCPLVRSMKEHGMRTDEILEDYVQFSRDCLGNWGVQPPFPMQQMMLYQQMVKMQKESDRYRLRQQSLYDTNQAVAKTQATSCDWTSLRPILVQDLKLFGEHPGCYLEGTIVGEAIQPMVGGITLVQDRNGQLLLVCFYNFLPDGVRGIDAEPLLQQKLPMGATLRIAEPFYKIFGDGRRGIRVDNPGEIKVLNNKNVRSQSSTAESVQRKCSEIKQQGNDFFAQEKYYAAMEAYLSGIRCHELVPSLLSNRSQALIYLKRYGEAFCDAAAALVILDPQSKLWKKTWVRYDVCLAKLQNDHESFRILFRYLVECIESSLAESPNKSVDASKGEEYKQAGNEAFKKQDYEEANRLYSLALSSAGETVRAMLSNLSLCGLETMALGETIAASVASLRIGVAEKSIYRLSTALAFLGEHELALRAASLGDGENLAALTEEIKQAQQFRNVFVEPSRASTEAIATLLHDTPPLLGNLIGPVETFLSEGKGRGLRSTRALDKGEIICCEMSPISTSCGIKDLKNESMVMTMGKNEINDASQSKLYSSVALRLQHDGVLNRIMNRLSDGKSEKPLVPLNDLMLNLEMFPLLLPGRIEFLPKESIPKLSVETMQNVLSTNTHGKNDGGSLTRTSELFPAISMINHASSPNCSFVPTKTNKKHAHQVVIIVTMRSIAEGEELTMKYHTDEVVARKWGISG